MFSVQHFIWLGICAVFIAAIVALYRKKRPTMIQVLNSALVMCLLSEVCKIFSTIQMVPSANGELLLPYLPLNHLPLHFCSILILIIAYARFTKKEENREMTLAFIYATGIIGAFMALMMPSVFTTSITVDQAFTSLMAYQFFLYHAMLIALGIIIGMSDAVRWRKEHYRNTLLTVYLMAFVSVYLNSVFASPVYEDGELVSVDFWTNFFFTYQNPLGIRLTAIWQWYVYLLIIAVLAALFLFLVYLPVLRKKK